MGYAYPAPRTGTAQDLFRVVTRAAERALERTGARLPAKSALARVCVEPFFRALGVGMAAVVGAVPADWSVAFHDRLFARLARPDSYPFDADSGVLRRARALADRLKRESGRAPALVAMISHPPADGELTHLNFELARHATLALRAMRGRPCRPRLVVAIDPFALDGTSLVEEGLYAGYMGTFHLGVDRLALDRGHPGKALTPRASWTAMPSRLLQALARGEEIGLVPAGGVPSTSRVFYGAREWTRLVRRESPLRLRPRDVERALRADAAFAAFERSWPEPLPRQPWRRVDAWLMAAAAGLLPDQPAEAAAAAALALLEVPEGRRAGLLADLARDLGRETPRRRRLFRVLAERVARRRPLVMLPVVHRTEPPGVVLGEAWSLERLGRVRVRARRAAAPEAVQEMPPEDFAARFIEENFA